MTDDLRPRDPTSGVQPLVRSAPDTPPPDPPHELEPDVDESRQFDVDGGRWLARVAGKGAGGTGAYGLGMLEAIHFFHPDRPETPVSEALLPRGRFTVLFDQELAALLGTARAIAVAPGATEQTANDRVQR